MADSVVLVSSIWTPINQPIVFPQLSSPSHPRSTCSRTSVGSPVASSVGSFAEDSSDSHSTTSLSDDFSDESINSSRRSSVETLIDPHTKYSPGRALESFVDFDIRFGNYPPSPPPSMGPLEVPDSLPASHKSQLCLFILHNRCRGVRQHTLAFNDLLTKLAYNDPDIPLLQREKLRVLARRTILHLAQKMEGTGAMRVTNRRGIKRKRGIEEEDTRASETIEFAMWTQEWEVSGWDGDLRCPQGWGALAFWNEEEKCVEEVNGEEEEREAFVVEEQNAEIAVLDDCEDYSDGDEMIYEVLD